MIVILLKIIPSLFQLNGFKTKKLWPYSGTSIYSMLFKRHWQYKIFQTPSMILQSSHRNRNVLFRVCPFDMAIIKYRALLNNRITIFILGKFWEHCCNIIEMTWNYVVYMYIYGFCMQGGKNEKLWYGYSVSYGTVFKEYDRVVRNIISWFLIIIS